MNLIEISKKIGSKIVGNEKIKISLLSSINYPKKNSICLLKNEKYLKNIALNDSLVFLVNEKFPIQKYNGFNFLISDNESLSFAKLAAIFKIDSYSPKKIQSLKGSIITDHIYIGENTTIGTNCSFGSGVSIGSNVKIGSNTNIKNNVVIEDNTIIGSNVFIDSGTVIGSDGFGNVLDKNFNWVHINHLGSVIIGDYVQIGCNCCIDKATIDNTIIENGVIIDNLVHIAHNVTIGENTAIAAKVGIAGSCSIGKRNLIGGMVGIVDHIKTADDVTISATSTVNKNLTEPGTFTGIMPISDHTSWKRIAFWISKLDKIVKLLKLNNF